MTPSHYAGPLRLTTPHEATHSKRCIVCHQPTINGEMWCYACKDPEGYAERLATARAEAKTRLLDAYPVCAACGRALSDELRAEGRTRHYGKCWTKEKV